MKIDTRKFRAGSGKLRLKEHAARVKDYYRDDADAESQLREQTQRLAELQELMYADNRWALLVIFQAMDAAGKDGTIKHVMSGINPAGCQVYSFKQPSSMELDHDFLWRTAQCLPERGRIGVFNRSYYEEVLVVRVHPEYLGAQNLPKGTADPDSLWKRRYESIREHEAHLRRNGTKVVKFFLHVSKEEQRQRFLARLDEPTKNWKFSLGDVKERAFWKDYQHAYQDCIAATSTDESPWYVVPADDKKNARLIVARVLVEALESLDITAPKIAAAQRKELAAARAQLLKER